MRTRCAAAPEEVYQELADGFGAAAARQDWSGVAKDMLAVIGLEKLLAVERATVETGARRHPAITSRPFRIASGPGRPGQGRLAGRAGSCRGPLELPRRRERPPAHRATSRGTIRGVNATMEFRHPSEAINRARAIAPRGSAPPSRRRQGHGAAIDGGFRRPS